MTQDDLIKLALIKLALESGLAKVLDEHASEYRDGWFENSEYPELLAFVNLVAGVEREAIAQMFEASPELVRFAQNDQGGCIICGLNPKTEAKAIRARGELK